MNPEPYHFIFRNNKEPFIDELIEFREVINDLPKTWSTFKPAKHFDRSVYIHLHSRPELVMFAGSWQCPDWFTGRGNNTVSRLVNPNAHDASRYTIAGTRCACGNTVHHHPNSRHVDVMDEHGEGCTPDDRLRAIQEIEDKRRRRILRGAHYNQSQGDIADCIDVRPKNISERVVEWGWDWERMRDIGRQRMMVTIDRLEDWGYTHTEIGEAFGMSRSSVTEYSNRSVFRNRTSQAPV